MAAIEQAMPRWAAMIKRFNAYLTMLNAEASLSRYPEWEAYKARSGMVFPKLFRANSGRQLQVE